MGLDEAYRGEIDEMDMEYDMSVATGDNVGGAMPAAPLPPNAASDVAHPSPAAEHNTHSETAVHPNVPVGTVISLLEVESNSAALRKKRGSEDDDDEPPKRRTKKTKKKKK